MIFEVAVALRAHAREGVAAPRRLDGDVLDRFLERLGVVDRADAHPQVGAQAARIEAADIRADVDRAHPILLPFLDLERDDEALALGIIFGQHRDDLNVGIAVLQIEAADQVAVGLDAVGVIDVGRAQERQQVAFAGLDDVLQAIGRVRVVADELDLLDAGLGAFGDLKDQIDAVVRLIDELAARP